MLTKATTRKVVATFISFFVRCLILGLFNIPYLLASDNHRSIRAEYNQQEGKVFHYVLHIPKTAGTYFKSIANKLLMETPEWSNLTRDERPFLCDEGCKKRKDVSKFPLPFSKSDRTTGYGCTAYTFEGQYNERADHIYTILREPKSHVLSQYFHCKESTDHAYGHDAIPSLDTWLEYWYNQTITAESYHDFFEKVGDREIRKDIFQCYMPVNMQSYLLHLNFNLILGDDEEAAIREIESKFAIIGDDSQITKTTCSIIARYSDIIPVECDCSDAQEERRNLNEFDHGVLHHGNTFDTSDQQNFWIEEITKVDQQLYKYGKIIFARQVAEVEEDFGVKLCDSFERFKKKS